VARGIYEAMSVEGGAATAGHRRSRELDAVRAVAALMVLAGHAYAVSGSAPSRTLLEPKAMLVNNGGAGIWLFFALSGYLIAAPFLRALRDGTKLPSFGGYLLRRGARILPAYWVAFAALAVLVPVTMTWWQPLLHGVLLQNLVPGEAQALFFVAWTLGIEVLFYLSCRSRRGRCGCAWASGRSPRRRSRSASSGCWAASIAYAIWAAVTWPGFGGHGRRPTATSRGSRCRRSCRSSAPACSSCSPRTPGGPACAGLARRPLAALALRRRSRSPAR
jgi:peptidoglycan/LPS O-acetylase OafA/YrhL